MEHGGPREAATVVLEYTVLDGQPRSGTLRPGDAWSFGRSPGCTEVLSLPALSRTALSVQHVDAGLLRVISHQSGMGRALITADDDLEQHSIGHGSVPVYLAAGNYTVKVELPPVVLRMQLAVPSLRGPVRPPPGHRASPRAAAEVTAHSWTPGQRLVEGPDWIGVVALAVALSRYPELSLERPGSSRTMRASEALRRAVGLWCGHTSSYWVNERLKEAITAADLVVPEGRERLAVAVAHYGPLFSRPAVRDLRDQLLQLLNSHAT